MNSLRCSSDNSDPNEPRSTSPIKEGAIDGTLCFLSGVPMTSSSSASSVTSRGGSTGRRAIGAANGGEAIRESAVSVLDPVKLGGFDVKGDAGPASKPPRAGEGAVTIGECMTSVGLDGFATAASIIGGRVAPVRLGLLIRSMLTFLDRSGIFGLLSRSWKKVGFGEREGV